MFTNFVNSLLDKKKIILISAMTYLHTPHELISSLFVWSSVSFIIHWTLFNQPFAPFFTLLICVLSIFIHFCPFLLLGGIHRIPLFTDFACSFLVLFLRDFVNFHIFHLYAKASIHYTLHVLSFLSWCLYFY